MLRLIATERTALAVPPEPLRLLVLSIVHPDSGSGGELVTAEAEGAQTGAVRLGARLSASIGDEGPQVHLVHRGDRLQLGARHFTVVAVQEQSMLGACVELQQVRPV